MHLDQTPLNLHTFNVIATTITKLDIYIPAVMFNFLFTYLKVSVISFLAFMDQSSVLFQYIACIGLLVNKHSK